ncbi:YdcF family protein [Paenibacillus sp. tmac-D7]|uniref:YdcF family protein n=1 Tax=Paenibacillus sp. tmac-D7 TaxID=2591462 RepID=UPI001143B0E4|nr:YdcF family protein [Paenibacillus sp. tmac-D7]
MIYVIKFVYAFLLPPGLFVALLLLAAGWLYLKVNRKAGWTMLAAALLLYAASIQLVSDPIVRSLENRYTVPDRLDGDVYVMLTGGALGGVASPAGEGQLSGSTLQRVVSAAELYKQKPLPILVSGGQVNENTGNEGQLSKRTLLRLGVPEQDILLDDKSRTTRENAQNSKELLTKTGLSRPILITSAFHMARSVKHFEARQVIVTPYPVDFRTSPGTLPRTYMQLLTPKSSSMDDIAVALKEYLGMLQ